MGETRYYLLNGTTFFNLFTRAQG